MVTELQNFLTVPEPEHHVWRLMVAVIILAIIVALIWVYSIFLPTQPLTETETPVNVAHLAPQTVRLTNLGSTTPQELTNNIIKRVASPIILSSDERKIILKQFGGVGSKVWGSLTLTERQAVINALNQ